MKAKCLNGCNKKGFVYIINTMKVTICVLSSVLSEDDRAARRQQKLEAQPRQSGDRTQTEPGEEQQPGEGIHKKY